MISTKNEHLFVIEVVTISGLENWDSGNNTQSYKAGIPKVCAAAPRNTTKHHKGCFSCLATFVSHNDLQESISLHCVYA